MGDQKKFRHPSDHATGLANSAEDPVVFAQKQLAIARAAKDRASIEQWLCIIVILEERAMQ